MSVKRLDPLNMETASKQTETANNNSIESTDKCPVETCTTPMRQLTCNGIPAFVCIPHRIALPCQDA